MMSSTMPALPVVMPHAAIAAFCNRNHVRKLSLFGSILTDRFRDESDVDMLVEFENGHVPGLLDLSGMELELTELVGRRWTSELPEN